MADKIRANYPAMQEMAKHLDLVSNRLTELSTAMGKVSQQMQGGVLQGQPGDAMVASLATGNVRITVLANMISEQSKGILAAIADMQAADSSAAGDFN